MAEVLYAFESDAMERVAEHPHRYMPGPTFSNGSCPNCGKYLLFAVNECAPVKTSHFDPKRKAVVIDGLLWPCPVCRRLLFENTTEGKLHLAVLEKPNA